MDGARGIDGHDLLHSVGRLELRNRPLGDRLPREDAIPGSPERQLSGGIGGHNLLLLYKNIFLLIFRTN